MRCLTKRAYRKNLSAPGSISVDGQKQAVTIKNLSVTGALAVLDNQETIKNMLAVWAKAKTLALEIPALQLAGKVEVVRIEHQPGQCTLALRFKELHTGTDLRQRRKFYRKKLAIAGELLLQGQQIGFVSVNVSRDGLLLHLAEPVAIKPGMLAKFRFRQLGVEGELRIVWVKAASSTCTWVGGQYTAIAKTPQADTAAHATIFGLNA